ncbi:hypothetical protein PQX77_008498 [Marasmius sp. AFHP31]|nr:hypothetical protein PQX77_008498 [Marasmius sp. AFHP31]
MAGRSLALSKPSPYLPPELVALILRSCRPREQAVLCRTTKGFQAVVQRPLYETIQLGSPRQAESFSQTILKTSKNFAALVKDLRIVIISTFKTKYDSTSFVALLNLLLLRLQDLQSLRIFIELDDKSYLHRTLSNCTFPKLHTFQFGQTGEHNAIGVLKFLKRHPSLKHLTLDTDEYTHAIADHSEISGDALALGELHSYSGPLNFLKFFAKNASSLSSVFVKLKIRAGIDPPTIPADQIAALENIREMGRGVSLAFETSVYLSRILQWTTAALPKLQSFAFYCKNGEGLKLRSGPGVSQDAVELNTSLFARFKILRKFIYHDSLVLKATKSPLNAAEDAKALGKICSTLTEIAVDGCYFVRKDVEGWVLRE